MISRNQKPETRNQRTKKTPRPFFSGNRFQVTGYLKNEKASLLVSVVWILSVLSVFTVVINGRASQELLMGKWVREQAMTRTLAKAGIERTLYEIQRDKFKTFDAVNETWSSNEAGLKDVILPAGKFTVLCETPTSKSGEKVPLYGACDEAARINLNKADETILVSLFMAAMPKLESPEAITIAQSIIDWRDSDDAALQFGAESTFYRFMEFPYEARNGMLESVEELLMIRGMTREIYEAVKNHVTVYSLGPVNFNTATPIAYRALGLSENLVNKFFEFRAGTDGILGNEDDGIFQSTDQITPSLSTQGSFSGEEFKQVTDAIGKGMVDVKSDVFRIRSISRLIRNGQEIHVGVSCVLTRKGDILYWNEME